MRILHGGGNWIGRCNLAGGSRGRCDFRQSEIKYFRMTPLAHKDVGGLDVAMNNTRRSAPPLIPPHSRLRVIARFHCPVALPQCDDLESRRPETPWQ